MEENTEGSTQPQEKVVCPNCEELISVPNMETAGESFPCPKCAFLISQKISGKISDPGILTKLAEGVQKSFSENLFSVMGWILVAVIAVVAGTFLFGWFVYLQWQGGQGLKLAQNSLNLPSGSRASEGVISNSLGMKLKLIPAGSFMMGSDSGEADE